MQKSRPLRYSVFLIAIEFANLHFQCRLSIGDITITIIISSILHQGRRKVNKLPPALFLFSSKM
jgi:hypothetical protein